jgi:hypothetical protein
LLWDGWARRWRWLPWSKTRIAHPCSGRRTGRVSRRSRRRGRAAARQAAAVSIWVHLSVRQSLEEVWRSGAEARGQVAGIARSMSRTIAMKAFGAGDKICPFYLRTLASNVHKSGGISTAERRSRPGRRRSHVLDREREQSKRKSPPGLFRRALIVPLSARDRSA